MISRTLAVIGSAILLASSASGGSAPPIRIACVGDRGTYGRGNSEDGAKTYPSILQDLLGSGYLVGDFVKDGATVLERGSHPYIRQKEFRDAFAFVPDVLLCQLGTYDSNPGIRSRLGEFQQNYAALIDTFRTLAPVSRIILLVPPPLFTTDSTDVSGGILDDYIAPTIHTVGYARKCEVVDLHALFLDGPEFFPDRVHPSARGSRMMAARIREFLTMESDTGFNLLERAHLEGSHSEYHGFDCLSFRFEGKEAKIALPWRTARGRPWIWRARFWGHEPQTEIALLERGFHVVYCDVAELFGNDEAIGIWERFYGLLVGGGLAQKSAMEGFSRGGVYIYRWAAAHPDRVACVYADAPVLDLKSWPGGRGKSAGNPEEWMRFKEDFHLATDAEAMGFRGNPIDLAPQLAGAGFPMLHVCGKADVTVPIDENTDLFEKIILAHGGKITVIRKPGVGHHPHSLRNPEPIVDFILRATNPGDAPHKP